MRYLILADRHVTYREMEVFLNISMKSIQLIGWIFHKLTPDQKQNRVDWCTKMLYKYNSGTSNSIYNIVTGDESWIYAYDPETKEQSTVWVFQDEVAPTKVARSRSVGKKMIACFFTMTGHLATVPLEDQKTVTAEWYVNTCLPIVLTEIRQTNPKRRIILHHDNASARTAITTSNYLKDENVELITYPPNSPDLAKIKKEMRGTRFSSPEEAVESFKKLVLEVSQEE